MAKRRILTARRYESGCRTSVAYTFLWLIFWMGAGRPSAAQDAITYGPVKLDKKEKAILKEELEKMHPLYDPAIPMIKKVLQGWNYHTDAESGTFHEVRASFYYAVGLLDLGDKAYEQRAFDVLKQTISLQDTVKGSRTCGVWPYYLEEPLATKKSPVDFNWADFNAVSLLDVYMGHGKKLPPALRASVKSALIRAAEAVQRRNMGPGYTNIAIMGTYVTYVTSHLFGLTEMQAYAAKRLATFYEYTLERGYTEYNSPTYTIVALDELSRMQRHIARPSDKAMVDSLYNRAWEVVARHFHAPSGQWAGPHSRSYSSLAGRQFYGILEQASDGKIRIPGAVPRRDVKVKHRLPAYLLGYFLKPEYPRLQQDTFAFDEPRIYGTTWLTPEYAFSSANRSSMWNQRRPFLLYWGTPARPHYLQARFLHDFYDFSAAAIYCSQDKERLIGAINFMANAGDKHINIDKLKGGKFRAKDLRLRFEFGNVPENQLVLPDAPNAAFTNKLNPLALTVELFRSRFGAYAGHWEKGGDGQNSWLDFVLYHGEETEMDLSAMKEAVLGFAFHVGPAEANPVIRVKSEVRNGMLEAEWEGIRLTVPVVPAEQPRNL